MDINDPRWEGYETRFRALVENLDVLKGPQTDLASAEVHLCLYGENGMPPEEELAVLSRFESMPHRLKCLEMLTSYWEDLVIYLPA